MMKSYSIYKDSGIEWIGQIPKNWNSKKIRRVLQSHKQGFYSEAEYSSVGTRLIRITDIDDFGNISYGDMPNVDISDQEKIAYEVRPGDILFARSGTIGRFGLAVKHEDAVFASYLIRFRFKNEIKSGFLKYFFQSNYFRESLAGSLHGGANKNIHAENIKEPFIVYPDADGQAAIIDFLDHKVAQIDDLIMQKTLMIELLKEERAAVINQAVTKGLDSKVEMKDSGVDWMGRVPKYWNIIRLRFLCGITTGDKDTVNREDEGMYPFFVRSPIVERISTYSFDGEAVLTAGDGVGVGKVFHYYNGKFDFHQRVYMFFNFRKVIGRYFYYFLSTNLHRVVCRGNAKSTVDSIRLPFLQDFPVSFPNTNEQERIVGFLDKKLDQIDSQIVQEQKSIGLLKEYRTTLISEAVTGKIDVREG